MSPEERSREYCDVCQSYVRQVFDKDAYALGLKDGVHSLTLEFTTEEFGEG